jgi:hypothetical protein
LTNIEPPIAIIKTANTENGERILKAGRGKKQIPCKGKPIKITTYFSMETLKQKGHEVRHFGH